jgi:hypothetical protein
MGQNHFTAQQHHWPEQGEAQHGPTATDRGPASLGAHGRLSTWPPGGSGTPAPEETAQAPAMHVIRRQTVGHECRELEFTSAAVRFAMARFT